MRPSTILIGGVAALSMALAQAHAGTAHYDIKAKLDLAAGTVKADVAITLPPEEVGGETAFVLGDWINLHHAHAAGATVRTEPTDKPFKGLSKIVFDFKTPPTRPVTLHFQYDGRLQVAGEKPSIDPAEGVELGFEDAWVPVRPNFSLLFTVDADIQGVPAADVVVAQGEIHHESDHLTIHRVFEDIDMPFSALSALQRTVEPDIEVYARHPDGVLETAYRKQAAPIVAYYSKLFGPLPPSALPERLVVLPRHGAAYERRAYISIPDGTEELKTSKITIEDWMLVGTMSHEISHGWWWRADPLTENHWLNESLAEYSSMRFTEDTFGADALKRRIDYKREPAKTAGPLIGHGRPSKNALYAKGPLLLFDLDAKIGRARMDTLLGIIGRNPPKTTAEFLKALADVAGPDVAKEFESQLSS
jgi:hypothetical protein